MHSSSVCMCPRLRLQFDRELANDGVVLHYCLLQAVANSLVSVGKVSSRAYKVAIARC